MGGGLCLSGRAGPPCFDSGRYSVMSSYIGVCLHSSWEEKRWQYSSFITVWLCRLPLLTGSTTVMLTAQPAGTTEQQLPAATETRELSGSTVLPRLPAVTTPTIRLIALAQPGCLSLSGCQLDQKLLSSGQSLWHTHQFFNLCFGDPLREETPLHPAAGTMM